jgi:hypothetical protein
VMDIFVNRRHDSIKIEFGLSELMMATYCLPVEHVRDVAEHLREPVQDAAYQYRNVTSLKLFVGRLPNDRVDMCFCNVTSEQHFALSAIEARYLADLIELFIDKDWVGHRRRIVV